MNARYIDKITESIEYETRRLIKCLCERRDMLIQAYNTTVDYSKEKMKEQLEKAKVLMQESLLSKELQQTQSSFIFDMDTKLMEIESTPKRNTLIIFEQDSSLIEELILQWGGVYEEDLIDCYNSITPDFPVGEVWKTNVEEYIQYGIAVEQTTNQIYVAEANGHGEGRISIFSEEGEYMKSLLIKEMTSPYGITIHRNNIYLTDCREHCVTRYIKEGDRINLAHKFGSRGKRNDQFIYPGQPAVSPEGELYIPDLTNKRIQILGETLNYLRTIKHESITCPRDVKLKHSDMHILNSTPHCILVFSQDGVFTISLLQDNFSKMIHTPSFFCIDSQNNFLVTDNESKLINIFFLDKGEFRKYMICQDSYYKTGDIQGIAYVSDRAITIPSYNGMTSRVVFYKHNSLSRKEIECESKRKVDAAHEPTDTANKPSNAIPEPTDTANKPSNAILEGRNFNS